MKSIPSDPPMQALYDHDQHEPEMTENRPAKYRDLLKDHWKKVLCYSIVWSWNFLFAALILFGIGPHVLVSMWQGSLAGFIPAGFALNAIALIAIPFVSMAWMLLWIRGKPEQQLQFFYGIQAPIFLLCLLRLFMIRVLTPGMTFLFAVMGVGMLALLLYLRWEPAQIASEDVQAPQNNEEAPKASIENGTFDKKRCLLWCQWVGLSGLLVMGSYLILLLLFHCLPLAALFISSFLRFQWLSAFFSGLVHPGKLLWLILFGGPLFAFSMTILIGMPIGLAWIYLGAWRKTYKAFSMQEGQTLAWGIAGAVLVGILWGGTHFNHQPQQQAFAMLAQPPKDTREQRSLLGHKALIHKGLLNAYLSGYRYLSTAKDNKVLKRLYGEAFGLSEATASHVQAMFNHLASPVLYQGKSFREDSAKAERHYAQFFDRPIQKAERKKIVHALSSTYMQREAEAGVLRIGERKVLLVAQHIQFQEHGDWAAIELHEVYQNQTTRQQEIFYYFSLPEAAVVTGLWLSEKESRKDRFKYVVAPRGAAQRVYKREVRRRIDPALLEQVGPRQYRLRAFPIPPQSSPRWRARGNTVPPRKTAPLFHLWMTLKVMAHKGRWPLPTLTQKRNVFWNHRTKLTINGKRSPRPPKHWLQPSIKGKKFKPEQIHTIQLGNDTKVTATPYRPPAKPTWPTHKRMAIILDRSYSMHTHQREVTALFDWLQREIFPHNQVDLYLTASPVRGEQPLRISGVKEYNAANTIYFGGHRLGGMLEQFVKLRGTTSYYRVFLLTDGDSYDLQKTKKKPYAPGAPLWIIHMGGRLAHAYEDATLATIQKSGGGVSTDLKQVLQQEQTIAMQATDSQIWTQIAGGYVWRVQRKQPPTPTLTTPTLITPTLITPITIAPTIQAPTTPTAPTKPTPIKAKTPAASIQPDDGFASIAAGQMILSMIRSGEIERLGVLDGIHRVAKRYSIVSPYSSMIVLVNQRQREALRRESARKDRFQRSVESGKATLAVPGNPLAVTGTPEPHEWLLIILVLLGLAAHMRQHKGTSIMAK